MFTPDPIIIFIRGMPLNLAEERESHELWDAAERRRLAKEAEPRAILAELRHALADLFTA